MLSLLVLQRGLAVEVIVDYVDTAGLDGQQNVAVVDTADTLSRLEV